MVAPRLKLLVLLALVAGCDSTGPEDDPAGSYRIESFGGHPVPYSIGTATLVSGSLVLSGAGSYQLAWVSRISGQTSNEEGSGSWTHAGGTIHFTGDLTGDGEYDGDRISVSDGTDVVVYHRD